MPRRRPAQVSLYDRIDDLLLRTERPTLFVPAATAIPGAVALLSGSFDPITIGHAALADAAADRADLVLLVYSVRTLPKEGQVPSPLLSDMDRLRALEAFALSRERVLPALASHGLLAEQAEAARHRFPAARLFLVIGSDKALQLLDPKWYPDRDAVLTRLFALAVVLYADRSGHQGAVEERIALPENVRWRSSFDRLEVPPEVAGISSREVRDRLSRGEDVRHLVPPEVHPFLPQPRTG
jgi:nicotinic acid mononucleotide adenylyltransferase